MEARDKNGKLLKKGDKVKAPDGKVYKIRKIRQVGSGRFECLVIMTGFLAIAPFWDRAETLEKV